jgi:hypothetical protein
MKRVWLVVDLREGSGPESPPALPEALEQYPDRFWVLSASGVDLARRCQLLREADVLIVGADQDLPDVGTTTPTWEEDREGRFRAVHFKGSLDDLRDEDFDEVNRALGDPEASLDTLGSAAKALAERKKLFESLGTASLLSNLLPSVIGSSAVFLTSLPGLTQGLKHAVVLAGFLIALLLWYANTRIRWTEGRAVREVWRSLRDSFPWMDPARPLQARFFPRYRGLVRTIIANLAKTVSQSPEMDEERRKSYLTSRIDTQIKYFQDATAEAEKRHAGIRMVYLAASILSALCVLVSFLVTSGIAQDTGGNLKLWFQDFGTTLFPAIAVWALGYIGLAGTKRRAGLYRLMVSRLIELRHELSLRREGENIADLVEETESVLLEEVAGWVRSNEF